MRKLMIIALVAATAYGTYAEKTAGFQLSLTPDIATQDRDTRIKGVSLGVWNENPHGGWSIGFVSGFTGDSLGFSWIPYLNILNYAENYKGVHWGWVNNTSGSFTGWQSGIVNLADDFTGFQSGLVNISHTSATGLQWGMVSYAGKMHGVQLGLVNWTKAVDEWAFQLGLVNVIEDNPWFNNFPGELATGFVIANWSFGGN